MKSVYVYARLNFDSQYWCFIFKDDDSEDEEDFNIKETDNLIAVGRVEEDYSSLEVHSKYLPSVVKPSSLNPFEYRNLM